MPDRPIPSRDVVPSLPRRQCGQCGATDRIAPHDRNQVAPAKEAQVIEQSPGVRRLCACVAAPCPGLLQSACRAGGLGSLYLEQLSAESMEIGFASPGVDEPTLVTGLISAMRAAAATMLTGAPDAPPGPALLGFHVGITRVEGDTLGGAAVQRVRGLLNDLALVVSSGRVPRSSLVVGITAGLYQDIGTDCGFTDGWILLAGASAWVRGYGAGGRVMGAMNGLIEECG